MEGEACKPPPCLAVFVNWASPPRPEVFDVTAEAGGGGRHLGFSEGHLSTLADVAVPQKSRKPTRPKSRKAGARPVREGNT